MAITVATNFKYEGQSPNFERDQFKTKAEMTAYSPNYLDEGHISFCLEDKKHYKWNGTSWEEFKTGTDIEIVNSLTDSSTNKALSAAMGKLLNEQLAGIVSGNSVEAIKFKGYVNVNNKDGVDSIFNSLADGEACLVVPSITDSETEELKEDSYLAWVVSGAVNGYSIPLGEDLLKADINASDLIKGLAKVYFVLDKENPVCACPDLLLLAKIRVKIKQFINVLDVSDAIKTIVALLPDSTEISACIGKILRWSAGDWLLKNKDQYSLTHKYEYNTDMDTALESGIIGYTATCTSGMPGDIVENYTVIINASSDSDPNFRTIQQIAYGRTGSATDRVWTRILFQNVVGQADNFLPWVEVSNTGILPNYNGWLLDPDECLETGVYQTCNSLRVQSNDSCLFRNNYFTMFVNASTSPNGDGYDAIEQTAYGRDADAGKIYRRVIFYRKANNIRQYGEWVGISFNSSGGSSDVQKSSYHGDLNIVDETFFLSDSIEKLSEAGLVYIYSPDNDSIYDIATSIIESETDIVITTKDYSYVFNMQEYGEWVLVDKYQTYSERFATKDDVATAIANAITNTLNTEV